ncbi:hypothetical protein WG66_012715 [Moniliophthora roreri]|nr:hypothetical protein WG66_012715 [Moniliophthora roreri]
MASGPTIVLPSHLKNPGTAYSGSLLYPSWNIPGIFRSDAVRTSGGPLFLFLSDPASIDSLVTVRRLDSTAQVPSAVCLSSSFPSSSPIMARRLFFVLSAKNILRTRVQNGHHRRPTASDTSKVKVSTKDTTGGCHRVP